ncbi:MAG: 16S rRNA (uracil(1498)-N(3))-methyltransferase [Azospirillaceae bacterium]
MSDSPSEAPSAPRTRLYVSEDLSAGAAVALGGDRAHYLRGVLRLAPRAPVALFNGRDGEWRATIEALDKRGARLRVEGRRRPQTQAGDLWAVFAPIKKARLDFLAEKATELGATALQPVFTRHTDVGRVNIARLAANAVEAAEQCERLDVPAVREPVDLAGLLEAWPADRALLVCVEVGEAEPAAAAARRLSGGPAAVLTGPEGGFRQSELDLMRGLPFVHPVGLGPRVLRAETAMLAMLALWGGIAGDGGERPPRS